MVWTLFYFLLASAHLAEAQTGELCNDMEGGIMLDPVDCMAYWMCTRTGLDQFQWMPGRCPDGYIAEEDEGCIEGMCDEVTVEPPLPPPPPPPPPGSFDCAGVDAWTCINYYWCKSVGGVWTPSYTCMRL